MLHSQTLTVGVPDSPGSSIFDLPARLEDTTADRPNVKSTLKYPLRAVEGQPAYIVLSGGTGGNAICAAFENVCYVLPVSDDGGSSSEIIRVLGGPSVGDIRSRLIRLIPSAPPGTPLDAIRKLLAYRLPSHMSEKDAREEWRDIVEGRSLLWQGVPGDRKETIRGFLVYFENELLKRAHKNFSFRNGSIGNYFIAAAQNFFRSLPSAIFLFSSITNSQANILPAIVTNHTVTIAAELDDGQKLVGQCEISHPILRPEMSWDAFSTEEGEPSVDGLAELISPKPNVLFNSNLKETFEPLPSSISRVFYINGYGMEIHPSPNPEFVANLMSRDFLVYSCGSLWTSIIPCLALKGVARAIASSPNLKAKVLLLNYENDRETSGYTAADYILSIAKTLNAERHEATYGLGPATTRYPISAFITDLVYLEGSSVMVDVHKVTEMGVRCRKIEGQTKFDADNVGQAMREVWLDVGR